MRELVGREHELRRLREDLSADSCRLVLVRGAAGIGKTSLVTAVSDVLCAEGRTILVGRCLPMTTVMPLLPVAEAVRTSARAVDEVSRLPVRAQAELARLLPDLAAQGPTALPTDESTEDRFRLFASVRQLLARLPDAVLVLDDLHWSDSATLDLLNYLTWTATGQDSLRVLATTRTDEPAPLLQTWLREAAARPEVRDHLLRPLDLHATTQQVALLLGSRASAVMAQEVFRRSEGNPFFTTQLATTAATDAPAALPHAVAGFLRHRMGELSTPARHVSAACAVLHRPATEDELAHVADLSSDEVREPLKELLRRKLLLPTGQGYSLRHALLAEVILEDLLAVERCELHGRAGEVLAARAVPCAAEVTAHFRAAGRSAEELGWALRAGNEAEEMFAYAEAAQHNRRALALLDELGEQHLPGVQRLHLLQHAAVAERFAGNALAWTDLLEEALVCVDSEREPLAAAVVQSQVSLARWYRSTEAGIESGEDALRLFAALGPSREHADALAAQARMLEATGRRRDPVPLLRAAMDMADRLGYRERQPEWLAWTVVYQQDKDRVRAEHTLHEAWRQARVRPASPVLGRTACVVTDLLLHLNRLEEVVEIARDALELEARAGRGEDYYAAVLSSNLICASVELGQAAAHRHHIQPFLARRPDPHNHFAHGAAALLEMISGDVPGALAHVEYLRQQSDLEARIEHFRLHVLQSAEVRLWAGQPGRVITDVLLALTHHGAHDAGYSAAELLVTGMRAVADLAESARARGDCDAIAFAEQSAHSLEVEAARLHDPPFSGTGLWQVDGPAHGAGWVAERGRFEGVRDATAWARTACEWEARGRPFRSAYARFRQASAHLEAGGSARETSGVLRQAAAEAEHFAPLRAAVTVLAQRAHVDLSDVRCSDGREIERHSPDAYGLTQRELHVLRLLAEGRTNVQIGQELFISASTVSVHVHRILRKLGVANRVEAAALAERAGLLVCGETPDRR